MAVAFRHRTVVAQRHPRRLLRRPDLMPRHTVLGATPLAALPIPLPRIPIPNPLDLLAPLVPKAEVVPPIPEPGTVLLIGSAIVAFALLKRKK